MGEVGEPCAQAAAPPQRSANNVIAGTRARIRRMLILLSLFRADPPRACVHLERFCTKGIRLKVPPGDRGSEERFSAYMVVLSRKNQRYSSGSNQTPSGRNRSLARFSPSYLPAFREQNRRPHWSGSRQFTIDLAAGCIGLVGWTRRARRSCCRSQWKRRRTRPFLRERPLCQQRLVRFRSSWAMPRSGLKAAPTRLCCGWC